MKNINTNNRWQLYEGKDYKKINALLDSRFKELADAGEQKLKAGEGVEKIIQGIRLEMETYMESIQGYGTSDTEARAVLLTLLSYKFG